MTTDNAPAPAAPAAPAMSPEAEMASLLNEVGADGTVLSGPAFNPSHPRAAAVAARLDAIARQQAGAPATPDTPATRAATAKAQLAEVMARPGAWDGEIKVEADRLAAEIVEHEEAANAPAPSPYADLPEDHPVHNLDVLRMTTGVDDPRLPAVYRAEWSAADEAVFLAESQRAEIPRHVIQDLHKWYVDRATVGDGFADLAAAEAAFRERFTGPLTEAQIAALVSWERSAHSQ